MAEAMGKGTHKWNKHESFEKYFNHDVGCTRPPSKPQQYHPFEVQEDPLNLDFDAVDVGR